MHLGTWTSLARNITMGVCTFVMLVGVALPKVSVAQTDVIEDASDKKKVEPVFRVSKLSELPPAVPNDEEVETKKTDEPVNRLASTNVLPARHNIVAAPEADLGANAAAPEATVKPKATLPSTSGKIKATPAKTVIKPKAAPHPLDKAVVFATDALVEMQTGIHDYTALLAKREQVNGVVGAPSFISLKVRCPRQREDGTKTPFSIYMKFLKPKQSAGREVIWVEGENEGKLCVHEGSGLISMKRFYLDPTGFLAMKGQRYPIYEAGLENLIVKLVEKAERDREAGPCTVNYKEGAEINKRPCSLIELVHNEKKHPYEFHKAHVFVDNELNVPVRFAAYDWPTSAGEKPKLIEEYTYYNIKVNVGLKDIDFSPENPAYRFPKR